jgi:hypothetical protein
MNLIFTRIVFSVRSLALLRLPTPSFTLALFLRTLHSPLLASFFPTMASTPTTASVAAAHGKYVKLVDMARVAGTDGERDNALRLLAKLFPGGAPEAPYVEPTTLITIKELGSGIT